MIRCYDVFDTALSRRVARPSDVFRLVHHSLGRHAGLSGSFVSEDGFVAMRRLAETTARVGVPECSLETIWSRLSELIGDRIGEFDVARDGPELERDCEGSVLYPNGRIRSEIEEQRRSGHRIVFVSDMYLGAKFLESQLRRFGLFQDGDELFVSSDYMATKASGDLYEIVMERLGGKATNYHMCGDNRKADVVQARAKGMKTTWHRDARLTSFERRLDDTLDLTRRQKSFIVGMIREWRLGGDPHPEHRGRRFVGDFLGPASMLWALWCLRAAELRKVDRLYFMARDAYSPFVYAQALAACGATTVQPKYLYGSRFSFFSPLIDENPSSFNWIMRDKETIKLTTVLDYFDISTAQAPAELLTRCGPGEGEAVIRKDEFVDTIRMLLNAPVGKEILEKARKKRLACRAYLAQEGLLDGGGVGIADIGWHLNVQSALWQLLDCRDITGFYVYLSDDRCAPLETGDAINMIDMVLKGARPQEIPQIWRFATVAEHLFGITTEGTTIGFDDTGVGKISPVCQETSPSEVSEKTVLATLLRQHADQYAGDAGALFDNPSACARAFRVLTDVFLAAPPVAALADLSESLSISSDAKNDVKIFAAAPLTLRDLGNIVKVLFGQKADGRFSWLPATLTLTPPLGPLANIALGKLRTMRRGEQS